MEKIKSKYQKDFIKKLEENSKNNKIAFLGVKHFHIYENGEDEPLAFLIRKRTKTLYILEGYLTYSKNPIYKAQLNISQRTGTNEAHADNYLEFDCQKTEERYQNIGIGTYGMELVEKFAILNNCSDIYGRISPFCCNDDENREKEISRLSKFYAKRGFLVNSDTKGISRHIV